MYKHFISVFTFVLVLTSIFNFIPKPAIADESAVDAPAALLKSAEPLVENFFTAEHWAAVRNLTGVARAIFIMPSGGQAGLLIGGQWGRGFLFVRHGQQWSDPLFIKLDSIQFGLLIGGQKVGLAGAVLSQAALDRVLAGKTRISGSADLTFGVGVSGRAAGGSGGGIEMLTVSSNRGLYFGGSFEGLKIWVDEDMNRQAYGDDFDLDVIIQTTGGNFTPAAGIQAKLEKSAHQAVWGDD